MSLFSSIVIWSEESFETIQALVESSTKLNKAINESRISVIRYNSILSTIFNRQMWTIHYSQLISVVHFLSHFIITPTY